MAEFPSLPHFEPFAVELQKTNLPGTQDESFVRSAYQITREHYELQTEGQKKAEDMAKKYRPAVDRIYAAFDALEETRKILDGQLEYFKKEFAGMSVDWERLFHAAKSALEEPNTLHRQRQILLGYFHRHFLRYDRNEHKTMRYRSLLNWYEYEYPLGRWGWTPIESQLIEALDSFFSSYFTGKRKATKNDCYKLIRVILDAAFGGYPDTEANVAKIKVRLWNIRRRKKKAATARAEEEEW